MMLPAPTPTPPAYAGVLKARASGAGHLKAAGCKYSYFEKEKWGQTLYFVRDHPQERPRCGAEH